MTPTSRPHSTHASSTPADRTVRSPVVVAVRGDQPQLLREAEDLAVALELPLRVVHMYWTQESPADLYGGQPVQSKARASARRVIGQAQQRLAGTGVMSVRFDLLFSTVVRGLESESESAAVLVVGAHSTRRAARAGGGQVVQRLALGARCPVLVVPDDERPKEGDVVAAVDVDTPFPEVLRFAADVSGRSGRPLRVVSVVPRGLVGPAREQQHARLDQQVNAWRRPGIEVSTHVVAGDVRSALLKATEGARLLAVGRPTWSHRGPMFGHSVVTFLLSQAPCPVAIVPPAPSPSLRDIRSRVGRHDL